MQTREKLFIGQAGKQNGVNGKENKMKNIITVINVKLIVLVVSVKFIVFVGCILWVTILPNLSVNETILRRKHSNRVNYDVEEVTEIKSKLVTSFTNPITNISENNTNSNRLYPNWVNFGAEDVTDLKSNLHVIESSKDYLKLGINLPGMFQSDQKMSDGNTYKVIHAPGAGIHEIGKPNIPIFGEMILIPNGCEVETKVKYGKPLVFDSVDISPVQPPKMVSENAPETKFEKDYNVYTTDADYPSQFIYIEPKKIMRGQEVSIIWVYPYKYNPLQRKLSVYPNLEVTIYFIGDTDTKVSQRLKDENIGRIMCNMSCNADTILSAQSYIQEESIKQVDDDNSIEATGYDYIIVTHSSFSNAAETFSEWKQQLGFKPYIATYNDEITAAEIGAFIQSAYDTWTPAPVYILLIGDAECIPTHYKTTHPAHGSPIGTDLYYATVDGDDYFPDLSIGRLSVDTPEQAMKRVEDIINYEKNPISDNDFYSHATLCAEFQDVGSDGNADRRFTQTSEDLAIFLSDTNYLGGYQVDRIYKTYSKNPMRWASKWWGGPSGEPGEAIPDYLRKPNFVWDGDANDIIAAIEEGRFLVTYRGHGFETEWVTPAFDVNKVESLNNYDKLPVVLSINCLTGYFDNETGINTYGHDLSFSEAWERNPNGGAIGVIASTRISYSGHNDRLFGGWIDAIWPDFISDYPSKTQVPIYRMGDVLNYGKYYYATKYSETHHRKMEFEMFHWFGDPSMRIRIKPPGSGVCDNDSEPPVLVGVPSNVSINCGEDIPKEPTVTGMDNCDDNVTINFVETQSGNYHEIITRIWTATDANRNTTSAKQIITIVDTTPPEITCPEDITVTKNAPPPDISSVTARDTCGSVTVIHVGDSTNDNVITRTYRATDENNNTADCEQIITVETQANIVAHIDIVHINRETLEIHLGVGDPSNPCWETRLLRASDNSNNYNLITDAAYLSPSFCNRWYLKVTDPTGTGMGLINEFKIKHGGIDYVSENIYVSIIGDQTSYAYIPSDTEFSEIVCPANITVTNVVPPADVSSVTVIDNCDTDPDISHIGDSTNGQIITRTYRVTYACGNYSDCTQIITNIIECPSLNISRAQTDANKKPLISFEIPENIRPDLTYRLQYSHNLMNDDWNDLATKTGTADWTPANIIRSEPGDHGSILYSVDIPLDSNTPICFMRLKMELTP